MCGVYTHSIHAYGVATALFVKDAAKADPAKYGDKMHEDMCVVWM